MIIECEHCGASINVDKEKKCSICGAPYKDNKEYIKLKEIKHKHYENELRNEEADIQRKEYENEIRKNAPKTVKTIMILPIVIFCLSAILMIFFFINFAKQTNDSYDDNVNDMMDQFNEEKGKLIEEEKTVQFNEVGSMNNYDIICDEVRTYNYDWYETEKYRGNDIKYIGFHIVAKNKSEITIPLMSFILTYTDSNGNTDVTAKKHSPNTKEDQYSLSSYVESGFSSSGYLFYELPNYVNDVKIHYGKLTINIQDINSIIKK